MATLGEAFIEVHADTKPFARALGPQLKAILEAIGDKGKKQATVAGKKISEGLDEGIASRFPILKRRFKGLATWIDDLRDRVDKQGGLRQAFERLAKGNFILTRLFGSLALKIGGAAKRVGGLAKGMFNLLQGIELVFQGVIGLTIEGFKAFIGVGGDMARVQSTLALGFTKIGTALAAAAAELVAAAPAVAAMIVVVAALGAALGALFLAATVALAPFAMLLNLFLAAPAILGAILAILGPLIFAFKDLDLVFKALNEKDPKKFAEDLKKLSPVMRELLGILRPFKTRFDQLRDTIQKAFFEPIFKQLGPAIDQLLSTLLVGMSAVASALGEVFAEILKVFRDPEFNGMLTSFMLSLADFLRANAPAIGQLFKALGMMAQAALPVVEKLLDKFGGFIGEFAAWIMGAITDGRFEQWLNDGISALETIWGLVKALINLFWTLFSNLKSGGKDFLKIITDAINKFTDWVKSPEGQHALENMVKLAKLIAEAFKVALDWVISMVNKLSKVIDAIEWINDHTGNPLGFVGKGIAKLAKFSGGGVVPHDQVAMVHKGEPILDPANSTTKNRSILQEAGMLDVLEPQGAVVNVYIGSEQLDTRIDKRIGRSNNINARAILAGPRPA